jgi:predicted secreted protein
MKKLISALLAVLLLAAALGGCASGPDKIDYKYDTISIYAPCRAQDNFATIVASEDLSTNFRWTCEQVEGSLELVYEQFVSTRDVHTSYDKLSKSVKDKGVHIWQFKAGKKNAGEAEFLLTQINAETGGEIKTETVHITVDKKGNVRWK